MSSSYNQGTEALKQIVKDGAGEGFKVLQGGGQSSPNISGDLLSTLLANELWSRASYDVQSGLNIGTFANGELTSDAGSNFIYGIDLSIVSNNDNTYTIIQGSPLVDPNTGELLNNYKGSIKANLTPQETLATVLAAYNVGIDSSFWDDLTLSTQEVIEQLANESNATKTTFGDAIGLTAQGVVNGINTSISSTLNSHAKVLSWLWKIAHEQGDIELNYLTNTVTGVLESTYNDSPNVHANILSAGQYTLDTFYIPASGTGNIQRKVIECDGDIYWHRLVEYSNNESINTLHFEDLFTAIDDVNLKCYTSSKSFSSSSYNTYLDALEAFNTELNTNLVDQTSMYVVTSTIESHNVKYIRIYNNKSITSISPSTINDLITVRNNLLTDAANNFPHHSIFPVFVNNKDYVGQIVKVQSTVYPLPYVNLINSLFNATEHTTTQQGLHGDDTISKLAKESTNPFSNIVDNLNTTIQEWLQKIRGLNLETYYGDNDITAAQDDTNKNPEKYPYPLYIPSPVIIPWNDPATNPEQNPAKRTEPETYNPTYPDQNLDPDINPKYNNLPSPQQQEKQNQNVENTQTPDNEPDNEPIDNKTPTPSNTGTIPPNVLPSVSASAMFNVHMPSAGQLSSFASYLWTNDFIDNLKKMFSDPMQSIVSLHQLYATPSTDGNTNIICGFLDSGVSAPHVSNQFITLNCGSVKVPKYYNNVMDNAPYTDLQLYLPFIGFVPLSNAECMGATLTITYNIDVYSGQCVAHVKVVKDGLSAILYQYGGNCSVQLPYSGGNWAQFWQAGIGIAASGVATAMTGGAAASFLAGSVAKGLSANYNISRGGSFGQSIGALSHKKPYLIIDRKNAHGPVYQPYGYGDNSYVKLSNCSGYVRIKEVNLSGIQATGEELREIELLLKEGVIV